MDAIIQQTVSIHAPAEQIWRWLTEPALMKQWMGEPELQLGIHTNWTVGSPVSMEGNHYGKFVNRGLVLICEPNQRLSYTHLSSVSHLSDRPENYTTLDFQLTVDGHHTTLNLTIQNFPTETIYKHLDLYWRSTLKVIREFIEKQNI